MTCLYQCKSSSTLAQTHARELTRFRCSSQNSDLALLRPLFAESKRKRALAAGANRDGRPRWNDAGPLKSLCRPLQKEPESHEISCNHGRCGTPDRRVKATRMQTAGPEAWETGAVGSLDCMAGPPQRSVFFTRCQRPANRCGTRHEMHEESYTVNWIFM